MDEVSDINMTLYIEGFLLLMYSALIKIDGLKSYMLNKIKDTYVYYKIRWKKHTLVSSYAPKPETYKLERSNGLQKPSRIFTIGKNIYCENLVSARLFHTKVKASSRIGPHNQEVFSVIIGSLLGDSYASARSIEGSRFSYRQSIVHKEYLFWLYDFFYSRGYCSNLEPRKYTRYIKKFEITSEYFGYEFNTFTFRSFNWIHKLFYSKGKKVIKSDLKLYFTPLALAVWIMDDGCWTKHGVRIATNNFSLQQVKLLVSWLKEIFDLDSTVQKIHLPNQYSIYIKSHSIKNLKIIVLPYMHRSMHYKLGLY